MTLKTAALLALVGTLVLTILLAAGLISSILNVAQGLIPAVALLTSFIYTFAALSVAVFFYFFHKAQ